MAFIGKESWICDTSVKMVTFLLKDAVGIIFFSGQNHPIQPFFQGRNVTGHGFPGDTIGDLRKLDI